MNKGDYWRDRSFLVFSTIVGFGLITVVLNLDNVQQGQEFTRGTKGYALGLALLVLLLALLLDWLRQRPWRLELKTLVTQPTEDISFQPQLAVTREQQAMQEVLKEQYRLYQDKLTSYREQQEQQNYFQSRWAHQMKTPLAVLDLLLQQWEAGEVSSAELASNLHEVRDKLAAGLELMLHNTRLSQFELDFMVQQVDLLELVRQTINEQKAAFIRYGVFPKIAGEQSRVMVETDPKWLGFVLNQILSNALKYSRHEGTGEKTIEFSITRDDLGVSVDCRDSGIGIPAEDLERVWQPFFTGANGRRFPEATGMGLHLAKKVCDRLGHRIAITSEVNVGTTVTLTFMAHDHLHRCGCVVTGSD